MNFRLFRLFVISISAGYNVFVPVRIARRSASTFCVVATASSVIFCSRADSRRCCWHRYAVVHVDGCALAASVVLDLRYRFVHHHHRHHRHWLCFLVSFRLVPFHQLPPAPFFAAYKLYLRITYEMLFWGKHIGQSSASEVIGTHFRGYCSWTSVGEFQPLLKHHPAALHSCRFQSTTSNIHTTPGTLSDIACIWQTNSKKCIGGSDTVTRGIFSDIACIWQTNNKKYINKQTTKVHQRQTIVTAGVFSDMASIWQTQKETYIRCPLCR